MLWALFSVTALLLLVQETFVAGPPVEVQVRVNVGVVASSSDVS